MMLGRRLMRGVLYVWRKASHSPQPCRAGGRPGCTMRAKQPDELRAGRSTAQALCFVPQPLLCWQPGKGSQTGLGPGSAQRVPHGAERGNGAQAAWVACCLGPSVPAKQDVPPRTAFSSHSAAGGHGRTAALLLGRQHRPGLLSEEASAHPMKEAPGLPRVVHEVLPRPTVW